MARNSREKNAIARQIANGQAPEEVSAPGLLDLSGFNTLTSDRWPRVVRARSLNIKGCKNLDRWPERLEVEHINMLGCKRQTTLPGGRKFGVVNADHSGLTALPAGLSCFELHAVGTPMRELPDDFEVESTLDLQDCRELRKLPPGLKVASLNLRGCTALEALPEGLDVWFLNIQDCRQLTSWPKQATIRGGRLIARNCTGLTSLPDYLDRLAMLDLAGCESIRELPEGLQVSLWIDVARTGIRELPESLRGVGLRWRGVPVNERIAFQPETLTGPEVLQESNAELRRVMLERVGFERFFAETKAEELDRDRDPGGERRLLRVKLEGDEDLVCLAVLCPSTGRQYLIRVPPATKTCHQGAAWIAGYDDPAQYRPLVET